MDQMNLIPCNIQISKAIRIDLFEKHLLHFFFGSYIYAPINVKLLGAGEAGQRWGI